MVLKSVGWNCVERFAFLEIATIDSSSQMKVNANEKLNIDQMLASMHK